MASAKNLFHPGGDAERLGSISLSCFSRPESIGRPNTAVYSKVYPNLYLGLAHELDQEQITKGIPGLKPVKYDEEGNIITPEDGGEDLW